VVYVSPRKPEIEAGLAARTFNVAREAASYTAWRLLHSLRSLYSGA
jgi:hypothetical protein